MRSWTMKKRVFAAMCVGALALAGAAVAYFTTTGSGSATATVGSSSAVVVKATVGGTLYPGVSQTVTFTIDNPSPGAQRVGTITVTGITAGRGPFGLPDHSRWADRRLLDRGGHPSTKSMARVTTRP